MSNQPPPFPHDMTNDGTWRPARGQRVAAISTPVDETNEARRRYREAATRSATRQEALPPMAHLGSRAPRVELVQDADGSVPTQAIPLMTGVVFEGQSAQPRALPLRPPEQGPPSAAQQRHQMAMASVQGAWRGREREDLDDMRRRQETYARYTSGGR